MSGVSASPLSFTSLHSKIQRWPCRSYPLSLVAPPMSIDHSLYTSDLKLKGVRLAKGGFPRIKVVCNSSNSPGGGPSPGESDSRSVLDAFFLGKALAEALNERIESTVGEFLSVIGRLQAEQQKQVQDFQEDVLERAKRAKEKAAREALEVQGLLPMSTTVTASAVTNGATLATSPSATDASTPDTSPSPSESIASPSDANDEDPLLGVSSDE